jgi:pimeloyl-ACP methyl ester carboxylesterase
MNTIKLDSGLTIAYREAGSGPAVLLLHGWPTSSYLWRDVLPTVARSGRVIALDLPGFGASDKPLDIRYTFDFFSQAIDGLADQLGLDRLALAGHDLGGPIALRWALDNPGRTRGLALLNTLVYPDFHPSVREFVGILRDPVGRARLTSPDGLAELFRSGVADPTRLSPDVIDAVVAPFESADAREALADAGIGLEYRVFAELGKRIDQLRVPVRLVFGTKDPILPDVAETMARIQRDLPGTVATPLAHCSHFLQEDDPVAVGELLATFFEQLPR